MEKERIPKGKVINIIMNFISIYMNYERNNILVAMSTWSFGH